MPDAMLCMTQKTRIRRWMRAFFCFMLVSSLCGWNAFSLGHADAVVLLVVFHDGAQEDVEGFSAALVENLIPGLVKVLGDLGGGGLLFVHKFNHYASAPSTNGPTQFSGLQIEELRSHLAHLAEVGYLAGQTHQVAGLESRAHCLGGLGQIVQTLRFFRQCLGFLAEQDGKLLAAVVVGNVALPVGKGGRMGRDDACDLEDRVAFAGGSKLG